MQIPPSALAAGTLAGIVLEFVTRDGTDHSDVDKRVASVMRQLNNGEAELHFDPESKTCNIIRV
ncbi:YheU family protein [Stieleria marina]